MTTIELRSVSRWYGNVVAVTTSPCLSSQG
jgi:hypothetical protein